MTDAEMTIYKLGMDQGITEAMNLIVLTHGIPDNVRDLIISRLENRKTVK